jgi:hypothetical protein
MGEWFSEGQLITALLGNNHDFMDPTGMPAKNPEGMI